ncbi:MAG: anti-sigma factor [Candidatus Dormibacteraeota bacterium]|nr:anti-sigma factor [Candidatus Dormibacteraeota bacterium]
MKDGNATSGDVLSCDQVQDLLGAFVLDSLDAAQVGQVRRHLSGCPSCRQEADELRATAMEIGEAVAPVMPPPMLRERILAEARGPSLATPSSYPPPGRRILAGGQRAGWAVAALAAALMLAAGGWGLSEHFGHPSAPQSSALTATALTPVDRLIASGQCSVVTLTPAATGAGQAALVTDRANGVTYVILSGLPRLHSDKAYTLWYIGLKAGSPRPVPVGSMTRVGAYRMPLSPKGFLKVAITREPGPHDATPLGPVLLSASLS